jgi:hypothetical protein
MQKSIKLKILCERLLIISSRFFRILPFRISALAEGIPRLLCQRNIRGPAQNL